MNANHKRKVDSALESLEALGKVLAQDPFQRNYSVEAIRKAHELHTANLELVEEGFDPYNRG